LINIIEHTLNMDLANKINMNSPINIKQNDTNSHKFVINLFNSSVSHNLSDTTSRIYFKKPDGTKVFLSCVLDSSVNNKLSVLLTTQVLTAMGSVACEITIYGTSGEIQTSFTFNFNVLENIRDDIAIESVSEFTALTNALAVVTDFSNVKTEIVDARLGETTLKTKLQNVDSSLADTVQQSPIPPKSGVLTNKPKLVILGATNDEIKIIQFNGLKYVIYKLDKVQGDNSATSVGGTWDLIRLKKVTMASNAYVAKKIVDIASTVGTLAPLLVPAFRSTTENYLSKYMSDEDTSEYISSSGDGFGIGVSSIVGANVASSVTWKVQTGSTRKCNVLVYGSGASSPSNDILVNGEVVKTFDATKLYYNSASHYKIIEFEMPLRADSSTVVDVTLRNNDTTNKKLYFSCCNFIFLKDYDGRDIDFYKAFGTSSHWINSSGANDYAIFDHDLQKFCGSYHGGETRISTNMTWYTGEYNSSVMWESGEFKWVGKELITTPSWSILPNFELFQLTNINGKGKMLSKFNFDTDGTMDMAFSFYEGTMTVEKFYTALTSTSLDFDWIRYPQYKLIEATREYLSSNDGLITQYSPSKKLSLDIRFTKFNKKYIATGRENGWIDNMVGAKKFYYSYADNYTQGVTVNNLSFRKALDFIYN